VIWDLSIVVFTPIVVILANQLWKYQWIWNYQWMMKKQNFCPK
jgi:hypothetical protein